MSKSTTTIFNKLGKGVSKAKQSVATIKESYKRTLSEAGVEPLELSLPTLPSADKVGETIAKGVVKARTLNLKDKIKAKAVEAKEGFKDGMNN